MFYLFKQHYDHLHYLCGPAGSGQQGRRDVRGWQQRGTLQASALYFFLSAERYQAARLTSAGRDPSRVSFSLSSGHSLLTRHSTDVSVLFINTRGNLKLLKKGHMKLAAHPHPTPPALSSCRRRAEARIHHQKGAVPIHSSNSFN